MDDATLAAIRQRAEAWEPRCQWRQVDEDIGLDYRCGLTASSRSTHQPTTDEAPTIHPFQYDPAADASPEADRARLLAELDRLRREHAECEGDGDGR